MFGSEPRNIDREPVVVIGAGQSGLAAASVLHELDVPTLVVEAGDRPGGSWRSYYDSLRLFSPAEFSSMPGLPFRGNPNRYPGRDEVADYLERYAATLPVEIETNTRVVSVREAGRGFVVVTADGRQLEAAGIVAASGSFSNPYRPVFPGQSDFTGQLLHVAEYRNPSPYESMRVVVVGAGDSAAQVANELAPVADVTIAARHPLRFIPQRIAGHDVRYWLRETGFDSLPPAWLSKIGEGSLITDSVGLRQSLADGQLDVRPMFTALDRDEVVWDENEREQVDAIILATGYRPSVDYLHELGALDPFGAPLHVGGVSTTHLGLVHVGLEYQRSFASNTLRGVSADAAAVAAPLAAWIGDAPAAVGVTTFETASLTPVN
jgi:putative flavoprotein involved in K+ transport